MGASQGSSTVQPASPARERPRKEESEREGGERVVVDAPTAAGGSSSDRSGGGGGGLPGVRRPTHACRCPGDEDDDSSHYVGRSSSRRDSGLSNAPSASTDGGSSKKNGARGQASRNESNPAGQQECEEGCRAERVGASEDGPESDRGGSGASSGSGLPGGKIQRGGSDNRDGKGRGTRGSSGGEGRERQTELDKEAALERLAKMCVLRNRSAAGRGGGGGRGSGVPSGDAGRSQAGVSHPRRSNPSVDGEGLPPSSRADSEADGGRSGRADCEAEVSGPTGRNPGWEKQGSASPIRSECVGDVDGFGDVGEAGGGSGAFGGDEQEAELCTLAGLESDGEANPTTSPARDDVGGSGRRSPDGSSDAGEGGVVSGVSGAVGSGAQEAEPRMLAGRTAGVEAERSASPARGESTGRGSGSTIASGTRSVGRASGETEEPASPARVGGSSSGGGPQRLAWNNPGMDTAALQVRRRRATQHFVPSTIPVRAERSRRTTARGGSSRRSSAKTSAARRGRGGASSGARGRRRGGGGAHAQQRPRLPVSGGSFDNGATADDTAGPLASPRDVGQGSGDEGDAAVTGSVPPGAGASESRKKRRLTTAPQKGSAALSCEEMEDSASSSFSAPSDSPEMDRMPSRSEEGQGAAGATAGPVAAGISRAASSQKGKGHGGAKRRREEDDVGSHKNSKVSNAGWE